SYNGLTIAEGVGKQTGMHDATGDSAWTFDSEGRTKTENQTIFIPGLTVGTIGITKSISYTYNLEWLAGFHDLSQRARRQLRLLHHRAYRFGRRHRHRRRELPLLVTIRGHLLLAEPEALFRARGRALLKSRQRHRQLQRLQ